MGNIDLCFPNLYELGFAGESVIGSKEDPRAIAYEGEELDGDPEIAKTAVIGKDRAK